MRAIASYNFVGIEQGSRYKNLSFLQKVAIISHFSHWRRKTAMDAMQPLLITFYVQCAFYGRIQLQSTLGTKMKSNQISVYQEFKVDTKLPSSRASK